jgi:glycosyltransferase involved in cell wall biosynthesis
MKVSGFTFLRNGAMLGFPFVQSIRSALPLCDEFIVVLGPCEDNTREMLEAIGSPKIRIVEAQWNEKMKSKGFVYGQQTNIGLYNCTGDWAFYLQGDEAVHEKDIATIRKAMETHLEDPVVEGLVFDYIHFYGNRSTYAWSPAWYRREVRVIKNTVKALAPSDGQFFVVLDTNRRARYPKVALANAAIYHYGWVRSEEQMNEKIKKVGKYWNTQSKVDYSKIDPTVLREFKGTHPEIMAEWLQRDVPPLFQADPKHALTKRERKHRWLSKLENLLGRDLSKKHYRLVR